MPDPVMVLVCRIFLTLADATYFVLELLIVSRIAETYNEFLVVQHAHKMARI